MSQLLLNPKIPNTPADWPPLFDALFWKRNLRATLAQIDNYLIATVTAKQSGESQEVSALRVKLDSYFALFH